MEESYPNGLKTLGEKEKLLVSSNFSFSRSVFKRLVFQGRQKVLLCGNGLKIHSKVEYFENTVEKGGNDRSQYFLPFHLCFLVFYRHLISRCFYDRQINILFSYLSFIAVYSRHSLSQSRISRVSGYLAVNFEFQIKLLLYPYEY